MILNFIDLYMFGSEWVLVPPGFSHLAQTQLILVLNPHVVVTN